LNNVPAGAGVGGHMADLGAGRGRRLPETGASSPARTCSTRSSRCGSMMLPPRSPQRPRTDFLCASPARPSCAHEEAHSDRGALSASSCAGRPLLGIVHSRGGPDCLGGMPAAGSRRPAFHVKRGGLWSRLRPRPARAAERGLASATKPSARFSFGFVCRVGARSPLSRSSSSFPLGRRHCPSLHHC
jgi:hypothetical protein